MDRRAFLASAAAGAACLAGCSTSTESDEKPADDTTATDTPAAGATERPDTTATPEQYQQQVECDASESIGDGKTVFTLGAPRQEPRPNSGVVEYSSLDQSAQEVVEYASNAGRIEACEVSPSGGLRAIVDAVDEAMAAAGGRPERVYVERDGRYHEVGLRVDDQVFYEP